jgi:hypothetical protein
LDEVQVEEMKRRLNGLDIEDQEARRDNLNEAKGQLN